MTHGWQNLSGTVDGVFLFIAAISLILLVAVTGTMIYFAIRYSRSRNPVPADIEGNTLLEIVWTVIPTLLVLAIFWAGWKGFQYMRTVPPDAMPVKVLARMWTWSFAYENGRTSDKLRIPVGKPVKLAISSADVVHSLSIPAFRVKEDAVPGRETYLWFRPDAAGSYDLFCTEYCGTGHSGMITTVEVMPERDFAAWYAVAAAKTGRPDGSALVKEKGCLACHSLDGSAKAGPPFKGLFGKKERVLRDGKESGVTVDEAFIRLKLLEPEKARIQGYPPIMPSQKGVLNDQEIDAIVRYLKGLAP